MWVTEERTVHFDGAYKGMNMWIKTQPPITISDATVAEGDTPYTFNPGTEYGPAGTYFIIEELDKFFIDWSFEAANTSRTFTIRYRVNDLIKVHKDVAELYFQFIGDGWDATAEQVQVNLRLPEGADINDIRAWGHGPLYGEVKIPAGNLIIWEIKPLRAHRYLEGRVTFPVSLVPHATQTSGKNALPEILAEEEKLAEEANREREEAQRRLEENNRSWGDRIIPPDSPALPYLAGLVILGSIAFVFNLWLRYGKEYKPVFDGEYYRELPADYTPAELGVLWRFGNPTTEDLTATLVDLARKGFIQIEEITLEKRGLFNIASEKKDYRVTRTAKEAPLAEHELQLLEFLFTKVTQQNTFTFTELEKFAQKESTKFRVFWADWQNTVYARSTKLDFFDPQRITIKGLIIALGVIMIPIGILMSNLLTPALIISGLIIIFSTFLLKRRSRNGAEHFARWRAFRRFLLDFSNLETHELPSLVVWEHYLVYAITLGVAKEVIKQLQIVFPNLESDGHTFGRSWFVYGTHQLASINAMTRSFDSINRHLNETIRIASSPRSSGSGRGGGFSGGGGSFGGGGGGFGGGGGGAR